MEPLWLSRLQGSHSPRTFSWPTVSKNGGWQGDRSMQPSTHTHTHFEFSCFMGSDSFTLYKLYILSPNPRPTPKHNPHRKLSAVLHFPKTFSDIYVPKNCPHNSGFSTRTHTTQHTPHTLVLKRKALSQHFWKGQVTNVITQLSCAKGVSQRGVFMT